MSALDKLYEDLHQERQKLLAKRNFIKNNEIMINTLDTIINTNTVYCNNDTITFSKFITNLDSFKDENLVSLLEQIEIITGGEFTSSDCAEYANRDFSLRTDKVFINIYTYLSDNPAGCRKVLVNTKQVTTEVNEYILECV